MNSCVKCQLRKMIEEREHMQHWEGQLGQGQHQEHVAAVEEEGDINENLHKKKMAKRLVARRRSGGGGCRRRQNAQGGGGGRRRR